MKVHVLGQEVSVFVRDRKDDPMLEDKDGYWDPTSKIIVVCSCRGEGDIYDVQYYINKVIRHEFIHAFLYESGLEAMCPWNCEEMIDWLVIQSPKIFEVFKKLDLL